MQKFSRSSGILLHISALPSKFGIGDLGPEAMRFADQLHDAGQSVWQILPLSIPNKRGCPYAALSAFGGNHLLISPEWLQEDGLLEITDQDLLPYSEHVDFQSVWKHKKQIFRRSFEIFKQLPEDNDLKTEMKVFEKKHHYWLEELCLFLEITEQQGPKWWKWSDDLRDRKETALEAFKNEFADEINFFKFLQFIFFHQWSRLSDYVHSKSLTLLGDMPIFIYRHSMEVWRWKHLFKIHSDGKLIVEAGVPPDAFSEEGQKWGNPHYRWDEMQKDNYHWWVERFKNQFELFDILRIDHFIGFVRLYEIPANDKDAKNGKWVPTPGRQILERVCNEVPEARLVAEDLGDVSDEVLKLRDDFKLPGMKILQFAFGSDEENTNLPHNITENSIVYTGTHDNDTLLGWFQSINNDKEINFIKNYLKKDDLSEVNWDLISAALGSSALMAIFPLQDIYSLGNEARFNVPGTKEGNWDWRFNWDMEPDGAWMRLKELTIQSNRMTHA